MPPAKKSRSWISMLLSLMVLTIMIAAAIVGYAWYWLHQPLPELPAGTYDVARGATVISIGQDMQQKGGMQFPQVWRVWSHVTHRSGLIKAGEFQLRNGMSPDELLQLFTSGKVVLHSVQFIEGSTFADMRRVIQAEPSIDHTLQKASDAEIMRRLHMTGIHPEGQFFPDKYEFAKGTSDLEIYSIAQRRMQRELQNAWSKHTADLSVKSAYEALILASIVEKESSLSSERNQIAGVFMDRLDRGMRLQTDPTVIYGLGDNYDGNIRKSDLQRDTPYNTYTRDGLPPTPICLPGAGSLYAATHPERSGALYFVASGEGGAHHFSKTYEEHAQAVVKLIKLQRAHNK